MEKRGFSQENTKGKRRNTTLKRNGGGRPHCKGERRFGDSIPTSFFVPTMEKSRLQARRMITLQKSYNPRISVNPALGDLEIPAIFFSLEACEVRTFGSIIEHKEMAPNRKSMIRF